MIPIAFFESRTVFLTIGSIHIYWYGVMYFLAFWLAWFVVPILGKMRGIVLTRDQWTNIVAFGALGVLIGGRLGYVLFYEPSFFVSHPSLVFQIWYGGMSSHGGFIGATIGLWWASRNVRVPLLVIADCIAPLAALGLALGRLGNGINQEFGMYPQYEATGDVLIALVCYAMIRRNMRGVFPIFLLLYSIQRFLLEYIRPQEWPLLFSFSRGQLLTIPLLIIAVILLKNAYKRPI